MKRQERYKLLNYAKEQYKRYFGIEFQFNHLSKKELHKLLSEYKHSSFCECDYCCYGLYQSCWQEPYTEGMWDYTQKNIDKFISDTIDDCAKYCRKDNRILYCEIEGEICVAIIMRDVLKTDYLIRFTNEEC